MSSAAHAFDAVPHRPRGSDFAQMLFDGLKRSGCIRDRASAFRWLTLRTRDNAQASLILDALFPGDC